MDTVTTTAWTYQRHSTNHTTNLFSLTQQWGGCHRQWRGVRNSGGRAKISSQMPCGNISTVWALLRMKSSLISCIKSDGKVGQSQRSSWSTMERLTTYQTKISACDLHLSDLGDVGYIWLTSYVHGGGVHRNLVWRNAGSPVRMIPRRLDGIRVWFSSLQTKDPSGLFCFSRSTHRSGCYVWPTRPSVVGLGAWWIVCGPPEPSFRNL